MQYKSFAAAIEQKDGGRVRAYASTFDRVPDSAGDIVAPHAFDKTISRWKEAGKPIPLLWGHDTSDPFSNIGAATDYGTDGRGLWFDAEFDADNPKSQYIRKLLKEGRVFQCSFAYAVKDAAPVELEGGIGANELRELDLFEISIVQIPANQNATVEDVKAADPAAVPEAAPEAKAGRRNSKKDADDLRSIAEHVSAIQSIVNGLLADELGEEGKAAATEAKPEEPDAANGEERGEPDAKALGLMQQAREILGKEE